MVIGVVGLLIITYAYYQTEKSYVALGEAQHLVSHYAMGSLTRMLLFIAAAIGIVLGYLAYRNGKVKLGLLGIGLCTLCLVLLYGYVT